MTAVLLEQLYKPGLERHTTTYQKYHAPRSPLLDQVNTNVYYNGDDVPEFCSKLPNISDITFRV